MKNKTEIARLPPSYAKVILFFAPIYINRTASMHISSTFSSLTCRCNDILEQEDFE